MLSGQAIPHGLYHRAGIPSDLGDGLVLGEAEYCLRVHEGDAGQLGLDLAYDEAADKVKPSHSPAKKWRALAPRERVL
jgi:hypothetical protein